MLVRKMLMTSVWGITEKKMQNNYTADPVRKGLVKSKWKVASAYVSSILSPRAEERAKANNSCSFITVRSQKFAMKLI